MKDEMINKTTPIKKSSVPGIGDTVHVHYNNYDMNLMNDPVSPMAGQTDYEGKYYTEGQSKPGSGSTSAKGPKSGK